MEGRAGSGRAAHGTEDPHFLLCDRPCGRTRVTSVRQLPTDHDYAVSTREYQSDQPSQLAASATACLRFRPKNEDSESTP